MATQLIINETKLPELMAREDLWDILPNIKTMSIRPDPETERGSELEPLLTVERSGTQRELVFSPHRTISQAMSSANRGILKSRDSRVVIASWNLMLKPPKDEEAVILHDSFYKERRHVHTIQTTSDFLGSRYTNGKLEGTLNRLHQAGSARNVKTLSLEFNFQADPEQTYASLAETLRNLFPFGSDGVHSLAYRAHRSYDDVGDTVCPTAADCFASSDLATACEGLNSLTLDVRGIIPPEPHIPKSLKELTLRYRVSDLRNPSLLETMASGLDKVDPSGSLEVKIVCDWHFEVEVQGMENASVASQKLEAYRLARKELYEPTLQEPEG
jgi:hypothetical protein